MAAIMYDHRYLKLLCTMAFSKVYTEPIVDEGIIETIPRNRQTIKSITFGEIMVKNLTFCLSKLGHLPAAPYFTEPMNWIKLQALNIQCPIEECLELVGKLCSFERLFTYTDNPPIPCFLCMNRIRVKYYYLEKYLRRRVLYCKDCVVKKEAGLLVSGHEAESKWPVSRGDRLEFYKFSYPLYLVSPTRQVIPDLNQETGPLVVFEMNKNANHPDWMRRYFYRGDLEALKTQKELSGELKTTHVQIKEVRCKSDVLECIRSLEAVVEQHGCVVKRISLAVQSEGKRQKLDENPQ